MLGPVEKKSCCSYQRQQARTAGQDQTGSGILPPEPKQTLGSTTLTANMYVMTRSTLCTEVYCLIQG